MAAKRRQLACLGLELSIPIQDGEARSLGGCRLIVGIQGNDVKGLLVQRSPLPAPYLLEGKGAGPCCKVISISSRELLYHHKPLTCDGGSHFRNLGIYIFVWWL